MSKRREAGSVDCHVHSAFSMDSVMDMETICEAALNAGLAGVCITDHVEHQPADIGYGKYDAEKYFAAYEKVCEKYEGRLLILSGIEFSEPHLYPRQFERYAALPYDCIIGSVHYWIGAELVEDMVINRPIEEAFMHYWQGVKRAAAMGGFDVLGHIDFPKRFYMDRVWSESCLSEIFSLALRNGIIPEINSSSIRKGAGGTMPDGPILDVYRRAGGRRVTIGSDAHFPGHVGCDLAAARREAGELTIGYFAKHRFIPCELTGR